MSPGEAILQRFGVQPAERPLIGWAGLCLVLLGAASFALLNTAETLFLKRVGVDALPWVLLASSALLVVTTAWVGRIASHDPPRWLPWVLVVLALAPLPFVMLSESNAPGVLGALVLISRQVLAIGMLAFWLAMGSLVPTRRAKQLFAPLAAGMTIGGVLGSFASEPIARVFGMDGLISICAAALAVTILAALRLRAHGTRQLDRNLETRSPTGASTGTGLADLLRTSRLFRLLAVALFCGGVLNPVLYFEFASVLDGATQGPDGEQALLRLYSLFRGWLNVAMLVSQLWLSAILYRRIGLPLSMATWPAAYLIGLSWLGFDFALFAAFASYGAAVVAEDGISDSAARVLYNLFPDGVRNYATGLLEGPVNRFGAFLGNGFVLSALAFGGAAWVGWAALPVAGIWLTSSFFLWRAYPRLLLRASAEHGLAGAAIDRAMLLDPATLRSLAASLLDPDPRLCRAAVDLIVDGDPALVARHLAEAIEQAPPSNRLLLVESLQRLVEETPTRNTRSEAAIEALQNSLRVQPPLPTEERGDLLQVYARITSGQDAGERVATESMALLEKMLGDRGAPVRLAAIAELHRRGAPPPGIPDLDSALADALAASDSMIRRAARKELRAILLTSTPDERWEARMRVLAAHLTQRADRAETAEALREVARRHKVCAHAVAKDALHYIADRDPRVRGALLCLAGHAGLAEEGPRMVSALGARAPEEADGAREGLVALGAEAALPLLVGLEFGGAARREAVFAVLRELEVDANALDALRDRQLEAIRVAVLYRAAVDGVTGSSASLLRRRLGERISEGLGALIGLLSAIHEDPRLAELERRLRRSPVGRGRDLLLEAFEVLLDKTERDVVLPLLEPREWAERGEAVADALGRSRPERALALAELRQSTDVTTRVLAETIPLEGTETIGDPEPMPTAMEIAVRLQDVPAFDRLNTQQLMSLAALLQEQKLSEGERIYAAGDEGLGLYFVLEGTVELRRGPLVLDRVGAGSMFGELATLDGVPRGEDAVACAATRVLRLDRDDLLAWLDEAPGLALGMAQFLSSRVRRLEDRLEEAVSSDGEDS